MRTVLTRLFFLYVILVVAFYVVVKKMNVVNDISNLPFVIEFLISLAVFAGIVTLYMVVARCSAKSAVRRHCHQLSVEVCPQLKIRTSLPFCQFGGIAKGWYIAVYLENENV